MNKLITLTLSTALAIVSINSSYAAGPSAGWEKFKNFFTQGKIGGTPQNIEGNVTVQEGATLITATPLNIDAQIKVGGTMINTSKLIFKKEESQICGLTVNAARDFSKIMEFNTKYSLVSDSDEEWNGSSDEQKADRIKAAAGELSEQLKHTQEVITDTVEQVGDSMNQVSDSLNDFKLQYDNLEALPEMTFYDNGSQNHVGDCISNANKAIVALTTDHNTLTASPEKFSDYQYVRYFITFFHLHTSITDYTIKLNDIDTQFKALFTTLSTENSLTIDPESDINKLALALEPYKNDSRYVDLMKPLQELVNTAYADIISKLQKIANYKAPTPDYRSFSNINDLLANRVEVSEFITFSDALNITTELVKELKLQVTFDTITEQNFSAYLGAVKTKLAEKIDGLSNVPEVSEGKAGVFKNKMNAEFDLQEAGKDAVFSGEISGGHYILKAGELEPTLKNLSVKAIKDFSGNANKFHLDCMYPKVTYKYGVDVTDNLAVTKDNVISVKTIKTGGTDTDVTKEQVIAKFKNFEIAPCDRAALDNAVKLENSGTETDNRPQNLNDLLNMTDINMEKNTYDVDGESKNVFKGDKNYASLINKIIPSNANFRIKSATTNVILGKDSNNTIELNDAKIGQVSKDAKVKVEIGTKQINIAGKTDGDLKINLDTKYSWDADVKIKSSNVQLFGEALYGGFSTDKGTNTNIAGNIVIGKLGNFEAKKLDIKNFFSNLFGHSEPSNNNTQSNAEPDIKPEVPETPEVNETL